MNEIIYGANYNVCCNSYGNHKESCKRNKLTGLTHIKYTNPEDCTHYHENPNICPCLNNCGCRLGICMGKGESETRIIGDRKMSVWEGSEHQRQQEESRKTQFVGNSFQDCGMCGKKVGSLEVHGSVECTRYKLANKLPNPFAELGAQALHNIKGNNEMNTEEQIVQNMLSVLSLNKALFEFVDKKVDDLTVKEFKMLVNIAKELRGNVVEGKAYRSK